MGSVMEEQFGIPYDEDGEEAHKLDLFVPESPNGAGILFIHGGGWTAGNRTQWHDPARFLCGKGYVCASVSYRLAPGALFPSQLDDVKQALAWLMRHADRYGFSASRMAVVGSSAGGHLAALVSMLQEGDLPVAEYDLPSPNGTLLQAAVLYCPATDLTEAANVDSLNTSIHRLMGYPQQEQPSAYDKASPVHRVKEGSIPAPTLILHGDEDPTIPLRQSEAYHQALLEAGGHSELVVLPGTKHGFGYGTRTSVQMQALELAGSFLAGRFGFHPDPKN